MRHDDDYKQKQFSYFLRFIRNIRFFEFEFFVDVYSNDYRFEKYRLIFFSTKNIFIFVQFAQLKFRKMIEIVIDIFENEKNVAKHHT